MRSPSGIVRLQRSPRSTAGRLTVPAEFMRELDPEVLFRPEWHEDGILYRVVEEWELKPPDWTKRGGG
jgi:hypothetical protein